MKAAVIYSKGEMPRCVDFPEPVAQNDDEIVVSVKAVALKHVDKSRSKGTHYSTAGEKGGAGEMGEAKVIGGDGVCLLADGSRVYGLGVSGMMAEKATVYRERVVVLPAGIDDATAAALPNAVFGAAMALRFRGGIEPGDTVLINGATGFTGRVAVQLARHYGAGRVIGTGRNERSLEALKELGADEVISLHQSEEEIAEVLRRLHRERPVHLIIDYLWGRTAEIILASLKGNGNFSPRTRFVSVGSMAGDLIQLSAANLRSVDLQLSGSGLGSWTKEQVRVLFTEILPEMFEVAAAGKLRVETATAALRDIETLWDADVPDGKRLVVRI
jgi:NADPH:quinone reductase-like Zn-dependent oxidoreductase